MMILNLAYPEKSDIKFKISKFPDGQQDIVIEDFVVMFREHVQIKSRFNSFSDLELIVCATQALRGMGVEFIDLYVPYLFGARSDMRFQKGGNFYLRDIIAPILNLQNYDSVTVLDVHSGVADACINNLNMISNVEFAVECIAPEKSLSMANLENYVIVSPDGGALKKIYKVTEALGYTDDVLVCSKSRDKDGKLSKVMVPLHESQRSKDFIIIDDICDGGFTFMNIAKEIRNQQDFHLQAHTKIYLIVTHGIFSKGFEELAKYFTTIYTTNSVKDHNPDGLISLYTENVFK